MILMFQVRTRDLDAPDRNMDKDWDINKDLDAIMDGTIDADFDT